MKDGSTKKRRNQELEEKNSYKIFSFENGFPPQSILAIPLYFVPFRE
jgi:hypothetical protein